MSDARGENARSAREENAKDVTACAESASGSRAKKPWSANENGSGNARGNVAASKFCARRKNGNDRNVCGWNASGNDNANSRGSGNASDKSANVRDCFRSAGSARTGNDWRESARGWNENACRDWSEKGSSASGSKNAEA